MPLFILALTAVMAEQKASVAQVTASVPVKMVAALKPVQVRSGEVVTVNVRANIQKGWHIYGASLAGQGPVATEVRIGNGWQPEGATTESKTRSKFDKGFGFEIAYHEGEASFQRGFRVPSGLKNGVTAQLPVTLYFQACTDKICLPPRPITMTVPFTATDGKPRPEYLKPLTYSTTNSENLSASKVDAPTNENTPGLFLFLIAAAGAGLLAILTPCVFPLIPLTITAFLKQSNGERKAFVRLSLSYAIGIILLYAAVGTLTGFLFGATGISRFAANPWVNLIQFFIFVGFALSFLEVINLRLPGNVGGVQGFARRHGGTTGLALLGATFVLASFTCVAPFVGTLLVAAANGDRMRPLLGMLVFAAAFASPFFLFAAFPQWVSKIPKSGVWLVHFKSTLGFIELAAALKFLSNADQIWQWNLFPQPVLLALWGLIFTALSAYLLGILRFGPSGETTGRPRLTPVRSLFSFFFVSVSVYCLWGLSGRPINPYVAALLPPKDYGLEGKRSGEELPWLTNYEDALALAKTSKKPLLIDFTGYTCTNCRFNEQTVFPHSAVQSALGEYVLLQLYTDGGKDALRNQELQLKKFGDVALPLYGVLNPETEQVIARTAGTQTPTGFASFLKGASL